MTHPKAIDLKSRIQHTVKEIPVVLSAKGKRSTRGERLSDAGNQGLHGFKLHFGRVWLVVKFAGMQDDRGCRNEFEIQCCR